MSACLFYTSIDTLQQMDSYAVIELVKECEFFLEEFKNNLEYRQNKFYCDKYAGLSQTCGNAKAVLKGRDLTKLERIIYEV